MGAFLSHNPGGRTVGNSFGDFEAGKLSNPPEFGLSVLAELPRMPTHRLQLAFRRGLRDFRGELKLVGSIVWVGNESSDTLSTKLLFSWSR